MNEYRRPAASAGRLVRPVAAAAASDRRPPVSGVVPRCACSDTATAWGCSKWTGRWRPRSRGWTIGCASRRDRAPRWNARARSPRRSATPGADATASGHSCCWRSRRCSIRPGRPPASTPRGRTATCRTRRRSDMLPVIEAQIERFAPGFRDAHPRPARHDARRSRTPQPEPGRRRHRYGHDGLAPAALRVRRGGEYATPRTRHLYLLGVDAARRRRPRHVRLLRRAGRPPHRAGVKRRDRSDRRGRRRGSGFGSSEFGVRSSGFGIRGFTQSHAGSATEPDRHARRDATCGSPVVRCASGSERSAGGRDCRGRSSGAAARRIKDARRPDCAAPSGPSWRCAAVLRKMNSCAPCPAASPST